MYILDTFFYFIHKFYSKVLSKYDDHVDTTILALSAFQGIFIILVIDFLSTSMFCYDTSLFFKFGILIFMLIPNYYYFSYKKETNRILQNKPKLFFGNEKITKVIVYFVFILFATSFIWQAFYHDFLDYIFCCK